MRAEHQEPNALVTLAEKASAPARQFNAMIAQNVEQLLRYQYAVVGDLLNLGLEQMTATVTATDPTRLMSQHVAIAARSLETAMKRGEDLAQFSTDVQARLASWADDAFDPDAFRA